MLVFSHVMFKSFGKFIMCVLASCCSTCVSYWLNCLSSFVFFFSLLQRQKSRSWLTWLILRMTRRTWSICGSCRWSTSSWTCWLRTARTLWSLGWVSFTPAETLDCHVVQMFGTPSHCPPLACFMFSGGLCNLSMDPECRDLILQGGGIRLVTSCLSNRREETVLSAITTLMNLTTPTSRPQITEPGILQCMLRFSLAESPRLRNLATVFLQDCCSKEQVREVEQQMQGQQTAVGIPLPEDWRPFYCVWLRKHSNTLSSPSLRMWRLLAGICSSGTFHEWRCRMDVCPGLSLRSTANFKNFGAAFFVQGWNRERIMFFNVYKTLVDCFFSFISHQFHLKEWFFLRSIL